MIEQNEPLDFSRKSIQPNSMEQKNEILNNLLTSNYSQSNVYNLYTPYCDESYIKFREKMILEKKNQEIRRKSNISANSSLNMDENSCGATSSGGESEPTTICVSNLSNSPTNSTPSSTRKKGKPLPDELKDQAYWERRRKNNEAAKRSRDARKAREDEIAIRAAFLEQENFQLKVEVAKLRALIYKI